MARLANLGALHLVQKGKTITEKLTNKWKKHSNMTPSTGNHEGTDSFPRKILLVTGRLAQAQVRAFAGDADVLVANVDVASFITPQMLLGAAPSGYDLILIPGAITADFREAERILGAQIRLGPKHAADLGIVL
ncbi:MAG: hypothetical protein M0Q43_11275, partial [Methanothrix sp.]|nr:hypothetical protein [Methanothrix sp.]